MSRTIRTAAELDALPVGSVVLGADHPAEPRRPLGERISARWDPDARWNVDGHHYYGATETVLAVLGGAVTVLHDPSAPTPAPTVAPVEESADWTYPEMTLDDFLRTRHQRDEARAEVARLTARPAPAWDEEAVVEGMARAVYPLLFADDRQPLHAELREGERDVARERMRQALAVVRDHLPDRETVIEAMSAALHVTTDRIPGLNPGPVLSADCASVVVAADAVLDLWPGRSEAEVKAEAWDEGHTAGYVDAADDRDPYRPTHPKEPSHD